MPGYATYLWHTLLKMLTANDVASLVSDEIKKITDAALLSRIRELLVHYSSVRSGLRLLRFFVNDDSSERHRLPQLLRQSRHVILAATECFRY